MPMRILIILKQRSLILMNKNQIIRSYLLVHFGWTIIIAILCLLSGQSDFILSYLVGSLLMATNFLLLYWLWRILLFKKVIALALILIVFKYAILGFLIYKTLTSAWNNPLAFSLGLLTLVPAIVSLIFVKKTK